ncbi:glycoside hydrolase family 5 protein [Marasmius fiardii PR-910]|nr:glycoside hydrolase family 5 protein [Marasmius fiardii PR-910]
MFVLIGLAVLAIVVVAVVVPVYFVVIKPKQQDNNSGNAGGGSVGGGSGNSQSPSGATSGGDGSQIITEDGETFTYNNKFGGYWVQDPKDPFNNNARANSWSPPLNESWDYTKHRIYGVNLGGLFVIEPFISPQWFEKYSGTVDEWTLSQALTADTANGGLQQLEEHYKTFITEKDLAEIAGAGLNWIRLPVPYWAIETWPGEPFLAQTSWKYILRVLGWARKYGLRVKLDLHTIPGSQNGYNHSGKLGQVNFLNGVMGVANAQRALNYIRIFTEFISQPEYNNLVPIFGIVNEALVDVIGKDSLKSFYLEAHKMIRGITGVGEGKGAYISIHDGFQDITSWAGFLPGADRLMMDSHPYFAFGNGPNNDPIATGTGLEAGGIWPQQACNAWGPSLNKSRTGFGVTIAGEFSNGYNDCGLFLRGVPGSHTYGGDCSLYQDSSNWNETLKAGLKAYAMASMDATRDYFFWTWKIGNSSANNRVEAPLWSYQLGLENGWMPTDPREADGYCAKLGITDASFSGQYDSWMTGGVGAGTIAAAATVGFSWPPASMSGVPPGSMSFLPTYTPTGSVTTLSGPTSASLKGWFNGADQTGAPATIAGCSYPDGWNAQDSPVPATRCGTGLTARDAQPTLPFGIRYAPAAAQPTPAP